MTRSWTASPARMAAGARSQRVLEPSTSVKTRVTVPVGGGGASMTPSVHRFAVGGGPLRAAGRPMGAPGVGLRPTWYGGRVRSLLAFLRRYLLALAGSAWILTVGVLDRRHR